MQTQLIADESIAPREVLQGSCVASAASSPIHISMSDVDDLEEAGRLWTYMQVRSRCSFFTSWGWIGCWLSQLPAGVRPRLLIAQNRSGIVGMGFVNRKRIWRGKVTSSRGLFLHETGDSACDSLTIEHNAFLAERGLEEAVQRGMIDFLCRECPDWDELHLSGVDADSPLARVMQEARPGCRFLVDKQRPCYMVDLAALRESGQDFLSTLGSSTRANVRKSIRLYEERGPLTTVAPRDLGEALRFYEELKVLHSAAWKARGESGAFSGPWLDGFHRRLIESRFPCGDIQLLQIRAGEQVIGALYNFVLNGHVAFYQSGFLYEENPKLKPGLVCHTLAVEFNREQGAATYDFLAGDSQYKRSLGQAMKPQIWGVLRRNRLRFRFEDLVRSTRVRLGALLSRNEPAPSQPTCGDADRSVE